MLTLFLKAAIFTVAATLKVLARTSSEVCAHAQPHVEGVIIVFSNQFGTLGTSRDFVYTGQAV